MVLGDVMLVDHLVGDIYPTEKYEFVNWDDDSQLNGQIIDRKCSKPPITIFFLLMFCLFNETWNAELPSCDE